MLTIPAAGRVEPKLEFGECPRWQIRGLLDLLESGVEVDLASKTRPLTPSQIARLVESAFASVGPDLTRIEALVQIRGCGGHREHWSRNGYDYSLAIFCKPATRVVPMQRVAIALEDAAEGLGRFVMMALNDALGLISGNGPPATPTGALHMASFIHWHGEDDEALALEEWEYEVGPDIAADPNQRPDIPTELDVLGHVPRWAYDPPYRRRHGEPLPVMTADEAESASACLDGDGLGLVTACVALRRSLREHLYEMVDAVDEGYLTDWPVVLTWSDMNNDPTLAVFDDNARFAMETGIDCPNAVLESKTMPELYAKFSVLWQTLLKLDRALAALEALT